jgi:hypothetical protein
VHATDPALPLELAGRVQRDQPVRVLVGERDVEAPVDRLVPRCCKRLLAVQSVTEPPLGSHGRQAVGIPLRHAAGLGDERDERLRKLGNGCRGLDAVQAAAHLRACLATELREQELDRPLGPGLLGEVVSPQSTRQIALLVRTPELPPLRQRRG